jgi:hypothetical protein
MAAWRAYSRMRMWSGTCGAGSGEYRYSAQSRDNLVQKLNALGNCIGALQRETSEVATSPRH